MEEETEFLRTGEQGGLFFLLLFTPKKDKRKKGERGTGVGAPEKNLHPRPLTPRLQGLP